jgi:hypothetical protein
MRLLRISEDLTWG